jgi:pyruvyl transferase EpsO
MDKKVEALRQILDECLLPLVDRDYVFIDLPYHPNVGDTLIAFAAKNILRKSLFRCLYSSSGYSFDNRTISPETLIIFNGGGNFGDLWKNYSIFRNKIIMNHPNNHFLVLPQSVCYCDEKNLEEDVKVYSKCGNRITICARDKDSYKFLKNHFSKNNVLLVPDMAFYTERRLLKPKSGNGRILFLRRIDKEFVPNPQYSIVPENAEVHDWVTMERYQRFYWKYQSFIEHTRSLKWYPKVLLHLEDSIWQKAIMPFFLRCGIKFVNQYDVIYSTRLHVAILGVLLGKQVYFFDNSYGKNSSLYNTWLKVFQNIKLIN